MLRVAICPLCEWRQAAPIGTPVKAAWARHVDDHAAYFGGQVARLGVKGVQLCLGCLPLHGAAHRACYAVDCVCDCSC